MKIVLTGSLGNISKPLAKELVQKNHSVTVVSSNETQKSEIEAFGAKAAIGSIKNLKFLIETFTGADIVYCMAPPDGNQDKTLTDLLNEVNNICENYKQAILKSGVKKVILLSSIGAHAETGTGLLKQAYNAEKRFNELPDDISIKFMRPVGFYYNLLGNAQAIKQLSKGFVGAFMALRYYGLGGLLSGKRGVIVSNVGGNDINLMVSPFDIASVIAEEIEKPFNGRTFRYIASEEMTCDDTAKILGEAIGKPYLKWGLISDKQLSKAMVGMKMSPTWCRVLWKCKQVDVVRIVFCMKIIIDIVLFWAKQN